MTGDTQGYGRTSENTPRTARSGIARRRLGGGILALGGALALTPIPLAGAAARSDSGTGVPGSAAGTGVGMEPGAHRPTLRRGNAARAGLLQEPLDQLVRDAEAYLADSPQHPWYAGAVLLAGRGGTVALHRPIGKAVRYAAYDEETDTGVEFPADQQIAMAEDTVFDLASISKLFTSLLAVQQIERGGLELEAAVASYLPDFAGGGKQDITVRQLLTHTSGFRSWIPLYKEPTREGKLRMLWDEVPASTPGSAYLYSDLNLISLQLILERITGRTLDVLLREEITAPLGMHRTRYNPPASWKPKIAATEDARLPWSGLERGLVWGEVHDENAFGFGGVAGHAGVFSCAWDLAVLARTLLNGGVYGRSRILSEESVDLLFTDFNTAFPATSTASASSSTSTGTWARWRARAVRGTPDSPGPAWCSTRRPTPSSSCWATRFTRYGVGARAAHPGWRPPTSSPGPFRCGPSGGARPGSPGWRAPPRPRSRCPPCVWAPHGPAGVRAVVGHRTGLRRSLPGGVGGRGGLAAGAVHHRASGARPPPARCRTRPAR